METCATHAAAFTDHGIPDGTTLIHRTYYHLATNGIREPVPSQDFSDRVANAFRTAFIRSAPVPLVPDPIDTAIDEATEVIIHRTLDDPEADLRTKILPAFYRAVAQNYCLYLENGGTPGRVGIEYDDDDGNGGIKPTAR